MWLNIWNNIRKEGFILVFSLGDRVYYCGEGLGVKVWGKGLFYVLGRKKGGKWEGLVYVFFCI